MAIDSINNRGTINQNVTRMFEGKTVPKEEQTKPENTNKSKEKEVQAAEATTTEDNEKKIKAAIEEANSKLKHTSTRCEFSFHEETNRISIKIIDKDTEEVVKEIPPEKTLEMIEKAWEIAGLLVDEKR